MQKIKSTSEVPRYRPYTIRQEMRKLSTPIRISGKETIRYPAPVITEYVDMETGEIVLAAALKNNIEEWPTVRFSERGMQREFILGSLRREVREFAMFCLAFRNQRRGISPGVDELVRWYAKLKGQQACHVRRYVYRLEAVGVIDGSSLLGPLFQIAGNNVASSVHRGEDFRAAASFMLKLIKRQAEKQIEANLRKVPKSRPTEGCTVCTSTNKTTVLEFLQALISAGKLHAQFS